MELEEFLEKGPEIFLPNLSIDLVIIGYEHKRLKCLLLKIGDRWALPGGYIKKDESVEDAVQSTLTQRTGLRNAHFTFLSVFGDHNRQFKSVFKDYFDKQGMEWRDDYWFNNRFVTLSYFSLVNIANTHPSVSHFDQAFGWFDFDDLPDMWMDHKSIVNTARQRLIQDIQKEQLTHHLLDAEFTMPELHQLHQVILNEDIDRSRFQKKMLASGFYERLPKVQKNTPGSNPYQYRVKV